MAQRLETLVAQGRGALYVDIAAADPSLVDPDPNAVYWAPNLYAAYENAWDQITAALYGSRKVFTLAAKPARIDAALVRLKAVLTDYERKVGPGLPWAWLLGGIAAFGAVAYFAGKPGAKTRKRRRTRRSRRRR
jgi:hypothetical protein